MDLATNFVVVGSGVAALRAAIDLGPVGETVMLTKASATAGSTGYAQGGIAAAVGPDDSPDRHAADTVAAGAGLVDREAARRLTERAPAAIRELIAWGARFDRTADGALSLAREGAHQVRRVLHARDATGREISRVLWERVRMTPNVRVIEDAWVTDAMMADGVCVGVTCQIHGDDPVVVTAPATLLAAGGAGYIYRETTNPEVATGDGVAIGYRAGATIADIEFVQFHPTALADGDGRRFLLSEALRGEGARLVNREGAAFLPGVDGELASRDRVARAIVREMQRTAGPVYLTFDGVDPAFVHERFPRIAERCRQIGLDLARDRIPVVPAAHYLMGGVQTDLDGRTSIPGLFAAGEVACTGVHGANRLASNSLLEGLVFGSAAAQAMARETNRAGRVPPVGVPAVRPSASRVAIPAEEEVRELLWNHGGVFRARDGLRAARDACRAWRRELDDRRGPARLRSIVTVGELMAEAALRREESRGAHYRSDFPARNEIDWSRHITLSKDQDTT